MEPSVKNGSLALVVPCEDYFEGDLLIIRINHNLNIIKRAVAKGNDRISVSSDNSKTSSSLSEYTYRNSDIIGKVKLTIKIPNLINSLGKSLRNLITFIRR